MSVTSAGRAEDDEAFREGIVPSGKGFLFLSEAYES